MKKILFILVALLCCTLCIQAQDQVHVNLKNGTVMKFFVSEIDSITLETSTSEGGENNPDDPTATGDATDVTSYSATIVGYANSALESEASDLKMGIIYCTEGTPNKSNGTQKTISRSQIASDGKFSIQLTGLSPATTYYYRSFVYQSGLWFYGKVRSFTTTGQDLAATFKTGAATSVTCYSAKVSAQMSLNTSSYGSMSYGICYGTEPEPTTTLRVTSKDSEGNYSATLRALEGNTIYYYRPYVTVDGVTYYGQVSSFKTLADNVVATGEMDADGNVRSRLTISGSAYSTLEVGLCWSSTNELPTVNDNTANTNELDDENYYVIKPIFYPGINHYRAYVKIDGVAHYGTVKSVEYKVPVGEAVDLGLSVKWATMNVGATSPEGYGYYFAWGETQPKSTYNWGSYFDSVDGSSTNFNKYSTSKKTTLDPEDDAAHVNWGGDWRMPTSNEVNELINNCTWTWTTQNGVNGYKVTSKKNGNSIFLPAAGYGDDSSLYYVGSYGFCWSSSLYSSLSYSAYGLYFYSSDVGRDDSNRYYGQGVRAVCP